MMRSHVPCLGKICTINITQECALGCEEPTLDELWASSAGLDG